MVPHFVSKPHHSFFFSLSGSVLLAAANPRANNAPAPATIGIKMLRLNAP